MPHIVVLGLGNVVREKIVSLRHDLFEAATAPIDKLVGLGEAEPVPNLLVYVPECGCLHGGITVIVDGLLIDADSEPLEGWSKERVARLVGTTVKKFLSREHLEGSGRDVSVYVRPFILREEETCWFSE